MTSARVAASVALLSWLAMAPVRAAGDSFLPLGAGARWEYEIHRDHTYRPAGDKIDRTFRGGTVLLEHVQTIAAEGGALHELRESRQEKPLGHGLPPSREDSRQLWSATDGLQLHAVEPLRGVAVRFEPPLRLLPPAPESGSRWSVGTWRAGELAAPLEAEAIGREDVVDGAQRWEGCLKVRYAGPVTGTIPVAGGMARLVDARLERIVWWKADVGPVREVLTTDGGVALPEGDSARIHEITTLRLVRQQPPR